MKSKKECIEILKQSINTVSSKYGVRSMLLFGSVARGEQSDSSDIDILVEMEPNLFLRSGLKQYLEELLGCNVDVLRHHKNMDTYLLNQIKHDGVSIF